MYNLRLGLWERLQLGICLPRDAPWSEMEQLVRISKTLGLTDEEETAIGLEAIVLNTFQGTITTTKWDDAKLTMAENVQEFAFPAADFERLKKDASARANWPRDERSIVLKKKFDDAVED